jgi:hypothetical protein
LIHPLRKRPFCKIGCPSTLNVSRRSTVVFADEQTPRRSQYSSNQPR